MYYELSQQESALYCTPGCKWLNGKRHWCNRHSRKLGYSKVTVAGTVMFTVHEKCDKCRNGENEDV